MKKDLLILFAVVLALAVLIGGSEFQSVEEYYLVHIDDIEEDSETVFISIDCADVLRHWEDLDPALQAEGVIPDKDATYLLYCRTGRRSAEAAVTLMELGYSDVYDFGGIYDWPYEVVR